MQPKIKSAILCDLVRNEDTGKQILIGVYTGDIVVERLPTVLGFSVWLEILPNVKEPQVTLEFRVESPESDPRLSDASFPTLQDESIIVVATMTPFEVTAAGVFKVSVRRTDGRWLEAINKNIRVRGSALASS